MASDRRQDRTYSEDEIRARLEAELPHWYYEDGWIRRRYRTSGWKGTLMVINTVGHLAEAAWHHPDLTASYAFVIVKLMNHAAKGVTDKDFERFDVIIAMDRDNHTYLVEQSPPEHVSKVKLFLEYSAGVEREVPDPYYGGAAGFERVLDLVEDASRGLLETLSR